MVVRAIKLDRRGVLSPECTPYNKLIGNYIERKK